jgi:hypothetical protein
MQSHGLPPFLLKSIACGYRPPLQPIACRCPAIGFEICNTFGDFFPLTNFSFAVTLELQRPIGDGDITYWREV